MRKLLCLAFLFLSALALGQTAVISGHTVTGSGTTSSSGISVLWELINDGGQQCNVGGVGLITPMSLTFTPAQLAAGVTMYKNSSITCGTTTGGTRWRYTLKANGTGTRSCTLNITGNTNLDTATCLNATATPTATVPTASLFWLLDGSNFPTGNFIPLANGTQAIGSSLFRWDIFADSADINNLNVTGTCTGCGGGGGVTPTGTGFTHITAGVQDGAARLLLSGDIPSNAANTSGNAATATALDHNPADCSAGSYATGIDATGAATGCTPAGTGTVTHTGGALTLNQLLFGNGTGDIAVGNLTGDVTTSGGKATTLATVATPATNTKITYNAKGLVTSGTAAACADLSDDAPSCNTDTTNAANITSGTLPAARMPAYTGDVTSPVNSTVNTLATIIPNAHSFSGAITYCTLQGMPVAGSSCFATLAACYAAIPSTGGTCLVPPNYSETLAANLTMNVNYAGFMFTGPASIVMSTFSLVISAGTTGAFIDSWVPFGSAVAVAGTGVEFNYAGTGSAFLIGSSVTHSMKLRIKDVTLFLNNAGSAAVALNVINTGDCELTNINVIGPGGAITQRGIVLDGTGNYAQCRVSGPHVENEQIGIQMTGSGVNASNGSAIIGGTITNGATSSIGIDFEASGTGNTVIGTDIENQTTGLNFGSSASFNYVIARDEVNTNDVTYGASACANEVHYMSSIAGGAVVVDPSQCNSTIIGASTVNFLSTGILQPRVAGAISVGSVGAPFGGMIVGPTGNQTMKLSATSATNNTALFGKFTVGTSDFVTAGNTSLQTITGLSWVLPANTALTVHFTCELMYSQQTAAVADAFGIQSATIAPTSINTKGFVQTAAGVFTEASLNALASTTATNIVAFTPSAITTVWGATLSGTIENPSNASTNTINIMVKTGTAADTVTVKRGSWCETF
jgi:hypothetical protein